jgi:hypothetical protein
MKKHASLLILILFYSVLIATAQKNSTDYGTDERSSKSFHFINIRGDMNVTILQDTKPGTYVEGTKEQQLNTITVLRNDTLYVYQVREDEGSSKSKVVIRVNELVSLEVSGKSNVTGAGFLNTDYMTIRASEGAQVKLDVRALQVEAKVRGLSSIVLDGSVGTVIESMDGVGVIDSSGLQVVNHQQYICPGC